MVWKQMEEITDKDGNVTKFEIKGKYELLIIQGNQSIILEREEVYILKEVFEKMMIGNYKEV